MKHQWSISDFDGADKYISIANDAIRVDYDDVDHDEAEKMALLVRSAPELKEAVVDLLDVLTDLQSAVNSAAEYEMRESGEWFRIQEAKAKAREILAAAGGIK